MDRRNRDERWSAAEEGIFDVAIIGGGINGAALYHQLCAEGYRVLLVDKGDFACGTSQASAMMVWGGLLYLRNLDFRAVWGFSAARDALIAELGQQVEARTFRYIPAARQGRPRSLVHGGLYLYWLLSRLQRQRPRLDKNYAEEALLAAATRGRGSLLYEEGMLNFSDCRFVLQWITPHDQEGQVALNYCRLQGGAYGRGERLWHLDLKDELAKRNVQIKARCAVNCAGVWTDEINRIFGIQSPYRHAFSKGVFIGLARRPEHQMPLVFDQGAHGDAISFIPWGPVALWGPTETAVSNPEEGYQVERADVDFLLEHARLLLDGDFDTTSIVSLRCGVRPLAVESGFVGEVPPMALSRWHRVVPAEQIPWISTYGGKITGCKLLAQEVATHIGKMVTPTYAGQKRVGRCSAVGTWSSFPGLQEQMPSLEWCMEHEYCCTLEDYLRRRTNIAQWVGRQGLGAADENTAFVRDLALQLSGGDLGEAEKQVEIYRQRVDGRFAYLRSSEGVMP
jgi:glycerol-3-phosphate dehydrogenase